MISDFIIIEEQPNLSDYILEYDIIYIQDEFKEIEEANNHKLCYNAKKYFDQIKSSYKTRTDIVSQFIKDYDRQYVSLNTVKYKCNIFCAKMKTLLKEYNYDVDKYYYDVLLLCCQSSYCLPYTFLSEKYSGDDLILVSGMNKTKQTIHINVLKSKICVDIKTALFLKHISTNTIKNKIELTINCDLKKNSKLDSEICLFSWCIS